MYPPCQVDGWVHSGDVAMAASVHPDSLASRLRAAIKARNATASSIAKACGFSRQNMQRFLDGEIGRSKHFPTMARELGVDVDWLMTGDPGNAPSWWTPPAASRSEGRRRRRGFGPAETVDELPGYWKVANCEQGLVLGPVQSTSRVILDPDRRPAEGDLVLVSHRGGDRLRRLGPTIGDQVVLVSVDGACIVEMRPFPLVDAVVAVGVLFSDS